MRHDDDIGVSVTRMLDDMPAETKEKILGTWCKEIKHAETKLDRAWEVFRITLKSGAGKCLFLASRPTAPERTACSFITIHTDDDVSTKRLCDFREDILHQHRRRNNFQGSGIANSIAKSFCCCPRDFCGLDQAGYGRSTTAAVFIPSAKERFCRGRSAGEQACSPFTDGESRRSRAVGRVRLRHCQQTQARLPDVWHANF